MHRFVIFIALFIASGCAADKPTNAVPAAKTPISTGPIATSTTAEPADSAAITQWHMLVLKKLEPFLLWPKDAPQDVKSASPWVRVKIDRQGHVLSATVIKSSGYDSFDKAARQVFKRAATLPPPPSDFPGEPFSFNMVVNFRNSLPASDR